MFKKILIVLMVVCFLLGMATRKEKENLEKTVETTTTEIEEPEFTLGIAGNWTQAEIEYFQKKEYVGDKRVYTEEELIPSYIGDQATKEEKLRYLRLLRNEIFARRGFEFKSEDLKEFFERMNWYKVNPVAAKLNSVESGNVSIIKNHEEGTIMVQRTAGKTQGVLKGYKEITILEGKFYIYIKDRKDNPGATEFAMMMWEGEPEFPLDFAVSKDGKKLYLLDVFNDRLQIFSSQDGRLLRSVKIETFEMANSVQIEESEKTWNPLGFGFSTIEVDSLFLDNSENIIVVGKEKVSGSQMRSEDYKPICYRINANDYSVANLSEKIRASGKYPESSSRMMISLEESKIKFSGNGELFSVFLWRENDKKRVVIENNQRSIETDIEILGEASVSLDKNKNFTIIDKQIDDTSVWNMKWNLSLYRISSEDGRILNELQTKSDYYSSELCLDEQGDIYYWERIPDAEISHSYETSTWRVVKLQGENRYEDE